MVFERSRTAWCCWNHHYGYDVDISADGDIVAVGARGASSNKGEAIVYDYVGGAWVARPTIVGDQALDFSGWTLDLSRDGSIVAVGSPHSSAGAATAGKVKIFQYNGSAWVQLGGDLVEDGGLFGSDPNGLFLSTNGLVVVIGNPKYNSDEGRARVLEYDSGSSQWVQKGSIVTGSAAGDLFGSASNISADGKRLAVGAPGIDKFYIYEFKGADWTLTQTADNVDAATIRQSIDMTKMFVSDSANGVKTYKWETIAQV